MLSSLASLRRIPLFAGVSDMQLEQLARMAAMRKFPRHRTIVHAGDNTSSLFVIVSGSVKVLSRDVEGREVILTFLGEGECFGEMGLIDGAPRSADVVAFDACELLGRLASAGGRQDRVAEAVRLYAGEFLPGETAAPWVVGYRQHLREMLERAKGALTV